MGKFNQRKVGVVALDGTPVRLSDIYLNSNRLYPCQEEDGLVGDVLQRFRD